MVPALESQHKENSAPFVRSLMVDEKWWSQAASRG